MNTNNFKSAIAIFVLLFEIFSASAQFKRVYHNQIVGCSTGAMLNVDIDNDNKLDLIISGYVKNSAEWYKSGENDTRVYKNTGSGYTEIYSGQLPAVDLSDIEADDFDNDGFIDIVLSGRDINDNPVTKIYRNTGAGFTEMYPGQLMQLMYGEMAIADYDNDGDPDIAITGADVYFNPHTVIYQNNGSGFTSVYEGQLLNLLNSNITWCDLDNDKLKDIIIKGQYEYDGTDSIRVYRNTGQGFKEIYKDILTATFNGSISVSDIDNDGIQDITVSGNRYGKGRTFDVYHNTGSSLVKVFQKQLPISNASVSWLDFNNDGLVDIHLCGDSGSAKSGVIYPVKFSKLYKNTGTGFVSVFDSLQPVDFSYSSITDINNDGALDLIFDGFDSTGVTRTFVYQNLGPINTKPLVPTNVQSITGNNSVTFKWKTGLDAETPQKVLTYNIRIGTQPGKYDIVNPLSDLSTGQRKVLVHGNAGADTTYTIYGLAPGTYYWSVQTVDVNYAASAFTTESSITISEMYHASYVSAYNVTGSSLEIDCKKGNGNARAIFVTSSIDTIPELVDGTTYSASSVFKQASSIVGSSQWYCVYNGKGTYCKVTGLDPNSTYKIWICEYTGASGSEKYYQAAIKNENYKTVTTSLFGEIYENTFVALANGNLRWCDYNNDGKMDFIVTGNTMDNNYPLPISQLYRNEGTSFTPVLNDKIDSIYIGNTEWFDINNDNQPDLIMTGEHRQGSGNVITSHMYKNSGSDFTEVFKGQVYRMSYGSLCPGDFNNDGKNDLFVFGLMKDSLNVESIQSRIMVNTDSGFYENTLDSIFPFRYGVSKLADINGDGLNDLLISASSTYTSQLTVYLYTDTGFIDYYEINCPSNSSIDLGDYDNDGDFDMLITGNYETHIYKNTGTGFILTYKWFIVNLGEGRWADYNNDGLLDFVITGNNSRGHLFTKMFRNTGTDFVIDTTCVLKGLYGSSLAWGDADNDGDLDLLLSGSDKTFPYTSLYINGTKNKNNKPFSPQNLSYKIANNLTILSWGKAKDDITPAKSLTYNVCIGTSLNGTDIASPLANLTTGKRFVNDHGNAGLNNFYKIKNLPVGKYYWRVQAIDQNYEGSLFSTVDSFEITNKIQAYSINIDTINSDMMNISFRKGNGSKRVVLVCSDTTGFPVMSNNTTYTANEIFGSESSRIGQSKWYCVYNGTDSICKITGLLPDTDYRLVVLEYTGNIGSEQYNSFINALDNPKNIRSYIFQDIYTNIFDGLSGGDAIQIDINGDNMLDILISGKDSASKQVTKVYLKGQTGYTLSYAGQIPGVYDGNIDAADYDGDGDIDILVSGDTYLRIYRQDASGFTEVTYPDFKFSQGVAVWGDFDNDGDLDILQCLFPQTIKIYVNNSGIYSLYNTNYKGVQSGNVEWGDVDGDGDLDILFCGYRSGGPVVGILLNDKGVFTEAYTNQFVGSQYGYARWGDLDADGDLDVAVCGTPNHYAYEGMTRIYENTGNGFKMIDSILCTIKGDLAFTDLNNDGADDIIITGEGVKGGITKVFLNKNKKFVETYNNQLVGMTNSRIDANGSDDQGRKLILISGIDRNGKRCAKLYRSYICSNTAPSVPDGLLSKFDGDSVVLSWDYASDAETPKANLCYKVCIYNESDSEFILSPLADTMTGYLHVLGNKQLYTRNNNITLYNLPLFKHFRWSVQAIDGGSMASSFAAFQKFNTKKVPWFEKQPGEITVCKGSQASISASFQPTSDVLVKWQKLINNVFVDINDDAIYSGTTNDTLTISTTDTSGKYRCKISNNLGSAYSDTAKLIVKTIPVITTQPKPISTCKGENVLFTVAANGNPTSYYWYKNGYSTSNNHNDTFMVSSVYSSVRYKCEITNNCGSTFSDEVELKVNNKTILTSKASAIQQCAGTWLILRVTVQGSNLVYQWQKDGHDIQNATMEYLEIDSISLSDAGIYKCKIIGSCGDTITAGDTLRVLQPVSIIKQPENQDACINDTIICKVEAVGTDIKYQWYKSYEMVSSETQPYITVMPQTSSTYRCKVNNTCNSIYTDYARVYSVQPTSIIRQPESDTVTRGNNVYWEIKASGYNLKYQWSKGSTILADTTGIYYELDSVQKSDEGVYACKVYNQCETKEITPIRLGVKMLTKLIEYTQVPSLCIGNSVTLEVKAEGEELTYQWYKDGDSIKGEVYDSLKLEGVTSVDNGSYTCKIKGKWGNETAYMYVNVEDYTFIKTQPKSVTLNENETTSFEVKVEGKIYTYTWQYFDKAQNIWLDIPSLSNLYSNSTTNKLIVNAASKSINNAKFRCKMTADCGEIISDVVNISVSTAVVTSNVGQIQFYPNPAKNELKVINDINKDIVITFFDFTGKTVKVFNLNSSLETIDIKELSKGIYFLNVNTGDRRMMYRLVKE